MNKLVIALVVSSALAGCSTSELSRRDEARTATQENLPTLPEQWASLSAQSSQPQIGWLETLDDARLRSLVEKGLSNNRSLQAAAANVDGARALVSQAAASLSPQVGASIGSSSGGPLEGSGSNLFNAGLQASWEVDLWGRIRSGNLAAQESFEAAKAEFEFAQQSLAANIAKSYFVVVEAQNQLDIARKSVEAIEETNRIVEVQFENGMADQQNVSLARSDLAGAREAFTTSEGALRNAVRSLELLLGRYPSAELEVNAELPEVPQNVPAGLPSQLLERRPDLIAAERQVAAAFNRLDQAKTANLPNFSLSGNLGGSSSSLSDVLNPANMAWQAISSLAAPIFDGGRIDAQIEAASAEQRAAVANYGQKALNAFNDVESALDQNQVLRERRKSLQIALDEAEQALRIANLQFSEGEISLLDVLTIQQRVFSARRNLLSLNRAVLSQYIDLNLALGGSWS